MPIKFNYSINKLKCINKISIINKIKLTNYKPNVHQIPSTTNNILN
jgi:hypothetical protein